MNEQQQYRLSRLRNKWITLDEINEFYCVNIDERFQRWFERWGERLRPHQEILRNGNEINRHAFEAFLQFSKSLPLSTAAAHLGMTRQSLHQTIRFLDGNEMFNLNTRDFPEDFVSESLVREFHEFFPSIRSRVFSSRYSYCLQLHEAIKADTGIEVQPAFCVTSEILHEQPLEYAYENDIITGELVGLKYQVWLNLGKPINLRPDICSVKFYVENENILSQFVLDGRVPEIPEQFRTEN